MSDEPKPNPGPEDDLPLEGELLGEEDVPGEPEPAPQTHVSTSTAVEIRPANDQVLMPLDTAQVVDGMKKYQQLLLDLLEPSDWQGTGKSKFLKKSGWRKIGRAFNLSLTKISLTVERDGEGNPIRAEAVFRALAPNGQVQDGDGYCSVEEPRFKEAKGRQKIENDLRATATTRAKNRAISDLVGMGEVSAEEVDGGGGAGTGWPDADQKQCGILSNALIWLFDGDSGEAEKSWALLKTALGTENMPGPVADGLTAVIAACKKYGEAKEAAKDKPPEGAPPPSSDPS